MKYLLEVKRIHERGYVEETLIQTVEANSSEEAAQLTSFGSYTNKAIVNVYALHEGPDTFDVSRKQETTAVKRQ